MNGAFWKSGELVEVDTCGVPSKLFPFENFKSRGTIVVGTVVVAEPREGLVPTILYFQVVPSDVKLDIQCCKRVVVKALAVKFA